MRASLRLWGAAALLAMCLAAGTAAAQEQPAAPAGRPWAVSLTPYLWVPSVDARLRYNLPALPSRLDGVGVSMRARDLLSALDFGIMAAGEARLGRFSVQSDVIYLSLSAQRGVARAADLGGVLGASFPISAAAEARSRVRGAVLGLNGGFVLAQGGWGHLDVTAGVRLLTLGTRTDIRLSATGPSGGTVALNRRLQADEALVDGLAGLRGRLNIGGGFSLPFSAEVGAGSSNLTWQAMAGLSYQWGAATITLGYRALHYEQRRGLLRDATFAGPFLSAGFRF